MAVFDQQRLEEGLSKPVALAGVCIVPRRASVQQIALQVLEHFRSAMGIGVDQLGELQPECRTSGFVVRPLELAQLIQIGQTAELTFDRLALAALLGGFRARLVVGGQDVSFRVVRQAQRVQVAAQLELDRRGHHRLRSTAQHLAPPPAGQPLRALEVHRLATLSATCQPGERMDPCPAVHLRRAGLAGPPRALSLHRFEELHRHDRGVSTRQPAAAPAFADRQLAQIEAIREDLTGGVAGEDRPAGSWIRPVAGTVERIGDVGIRRALGSPLEGQDQAAVIRCHMAADLERAGVSDRHAVRSLHHAERQAACVEPPLFAFGPAFFRLAAQVPRVPLGQRPEHAQEEKTLGSRVIQVRLGDGGETDPAAAQPLEALQGGAQLPREPVHLVDDDDRELAGLGVGHQALECRPFGEVVRVGRDTFVREFGNDGVTAGGCELATGSPLRVQAVPVHLLARANPNVDGRSRRRGGRLG